MKNLKIANNQERFKALKLAEIRQTDLEDFENCVNDMQKNASLDNDDAIVVASAIRSKYLPNILRESGINEMVNLDDEAEETADFAKDNENDDDMEMHHFEDGEDDDTDDMMDDEDEVEDTDTATFEIEVPADMVDAARQAVQEALDNLLGEDMDSDVDMEDDDMDDEEDLEDDEMESEDDKSEAEMHKTSNKVNNMTKQALAARRAEREEILKRLASEEEKYPASADFKYSNEMANMPGEKDYPTFKFDGDNPLKGDNPDFAPQNVPTMNGLDDHPGVSSSKMEGTPSGDLEYTCDWEALENPSEGFDGEMFAVPTEMPMEHNTTPSGNQRIAGAEKHAVECTSCGYKMALTEAEMETASCPHCDGEEKEATTVSLPMTGVNVPPGQKITVQASLDTARIKTAYSCSSKLALAGIIETSEVDSYAEQMLNDDLKADAMIRQTKLLLKSAQASSERVAAAAAERMSVRTASTNGISTSPAFTSSVSANSAALDIQSALKGTWTMPQIED